MAKNSSFPSEVGAFHRVLLSGFHLSYQHDRALAESRVIAEGVFYRLFLRVPIVGIHAFKGEHQARRPRSSPRATRWNVGGTPAGTPPDPEERPGNDEGPGL